MHTAVCRVTRDLAAFSLTSLVLVIALGAMPLRAIAETPVSIAMKLLVVSADGTEPSFAAITSVLNQVGVPYDALIATKTPLTATMLSDGLGNGRYQGVLPSTGNLGYLNASTGTYESAFSAAQWQTQWNYEQAFRVRQATLYTYPSGFPDNYGLTLITCANTTTTPMQATQLGDLIAATLARYNALFALPVSRRAEHDIGVSMAARMAYNASGAAGTLLLGASGNRIRLATTNAVTMPVTGISCGTSVETYGGQPISSIAMPAGGTVTVPGPA
ncbi:Agd3-related carbohydrate-binding protein [Burkholderia sp. MR1-5-21]